MAELCPTKDPARGRSSVKAAAFFTGRVQGIAGELRRAGSARPPPGRGMRRVIRDPKSIDPLTAMPAVGVSEQDARDIAAHLATLH